MYGETVQARMSYSYCGVKIKFGRHHYSGSFVSVESV